MDFGYAQVATIFTFHVDFGDAIFELHFILKLWIGLESEPRGIVHFIFKLNFKL